MYFHRLFGALVLGLFTLTLSACEDLELPDILPPPGQPAPTQPPATSPPPAAQPVAFVEVLNGVVKIGNTAIVGRQPLFVNQKVSTENGRALIDFVGDGTLTMEPFSDPMPLLIQQAGCATGQLVVMLWNGTFTAQGVSDVCFVNQRHETSADPNSDFRIVITDQNFGLTVTSGQVLVSSGPTRAVRDMVPAGFGIVVEFGKTEGPRRIIQ